MLREAPFVIEWFLCKETVQGILYNDYREVERASK